MHASDVSSPLTQPGVGWALACSRRGATHRHHGQRCQDAHAVWSASFSGAAGVVVAVADGHGDPKHDLSHVGAALAVQAATEALAGVFAELRRAAPPPGGPAAGPYRESARGRFLRQVRTDLPDRVVRRWRAAVLDDADIADRAPMPRHIGVADFFSRYGTTLLAALVTEDVMLFAQLGDGDLLWVSDKGEIEVLFPAPEAASHVTTSLCSEDAARLMQVGVRHRLESGALVLATDGLANAFGGDGSFEAYVKGLAERARKYRPQDVAAALPGWLDDCSRGGSGDDITVALVRVEPPPLLGLSNRRQALEGERRHLEELHRTERERARQRHREELGGLTQKERDLARERSALQLRHQNELTELEKALQDKSAALNLQHAELETEISEAKKAFNHTVNNLG